MIEIIYNRPVFLFHDYNSILIFFANILPQRFCAVRSGCINNHTTHIGDSSIRDYFPLNSELGEDASSSPFCKTETHKLIFPDLSLANIAWQGRYNMVPSLLKETKV